MFGGSAAIVEDIIAYKAGSIKNITLKPNTGISEDTVRSVNIFAGDLDGDGNLEVPVQRLLRSQTETSYYAIDWYRYSSDGQRRLAYSTYHDFSDGWYLILPGDWGDDVTVRREDTVAGGTRARFFRAWPRRIRRFRIFS